MYNFIKREKKLGTSNYYSIDRVEVNGEILEADCTVDDEHKYIVCSLENIDKYINKNHFTEGIGFIMKNNESNFPKYISQIILTKKYSCKYRIRIWIEFSYATFESKWSPQFFASKFEEIFIQSNIYEEDTTIESNESDRDYYAEVNFFIDNLASVYSDISKCISQIITAYKNTNEYLDTYNGGYAYNTYNIPVDNKFKIALKQYLIYFPEYINKAKGMKINFEVSSNDNFLSIHIQNDVDWELMDGYLKEYVGFIKQTIDNINPEIRSDLGGLERELLLIDLRNQIYHLKTSIQIKDIKIGLLEETVELLRETIKNNSNNPIAINVTLNSNSVITSNINFNIKDELKNLQNEFFDMKGKLIYTDDGIKNEINDIDNELMKLDDNNPDNIKENKHVFKKIGRLLEKFNDSNSDMNKILKQSKEGVKKIQKLAKVYNKFAQWLALPQVPDIFLNNEKLQD